MEEDSNIINNVNNTKEVSNIQQETNQIIEVNKFELSEIVNYKDVIELFGMIFFIVALISIYIFYKRIINRRSKNYYENNVRNKKYIEDIYVEIGETSEKIRYFIYAEKWKKRIRKSLKTIMSKNNKKIANKIYKIRGISLNKKLDNYEKLLTKVKENKGKGVKYQNELWFLEHNSYYYRDEIGDLRQKLQIINSKILFILGKAGSGKTNLATYMAKLITEKNKYFCIYMNAKDIKDRNIEEYFKEFFYTDMIINKEREKLIYLYLITLKLLRKKMYIIVEALNENTDSNFVYNLSMFINKYSKYDNLRFIITSRIEFFDVKYKKVIDEYYLGEVNEEDLKEGAIKGYIEGLNDPYTEYITKEDMEDYLADTLGNFVGIGIYMVKNTQNNTIEVLSPIKNSPAQAAGILPGDIIKSINGVEYTGDEMSVAAAKIKGEEGSSVKLEIIRGTETLNFDIKREKIKVNQIEGKMLEDNIAYIEIPSFDEETANDFKSKWEELEKQNAKSLIIDLRNNGGGIVDEALEIADFMTEKDSVLLYEIDKNNNEKVRKSKNDPIINVPIIILTNENTASSSEILAGALKDLGKAKIVEILL